MSAPTASAVLPGPPPTTSCRWTHPSARPARTGSDSGDAKDFVAVAAEVAEAAAQAVQVTQVAQAVPTDEGAPVAAAPAATGGVGSTEPVAVPLPVPGTAREVMPPIGGVAAAQPGPRRGATSATTAAGTPVVTTPVATMPLATTPRPGSAPAQAPAGPTPPVDGTAVPARDPRTTAAVVPPLPPRPATAQPPGADPAHPAVAAAARTEHDTAPAHPATTTAAAAAAEGTTATPVLTAPTSSAPAAQAPVVEQPPAAHETPATQVAQVLAPLRRMPDGSHRLTVQLHPAELGAVRVVVELRDGAMNVQLGGGDLARHTLREALPDLRHQLQELGVDAGSIDVTSWDGADHGQPWTDAMPGQQDRRPGPSDDRSAPGRRPPDPGPPAEPSTSPTPGPAGVDVRV